MYCKFLSRAMGVSALLAWLYPLNALAHSLDVSYLDFSASSSSELTLTAAVHPHEVFEIVRTASSTTFDLEMIQRSGELITAYVEEHVRVWQNGQACEWSPGSAETPVSEFEAVADGVTVSGPLSCPEQADQLEAESTLFLEGFPSQTTVVRKETPDGYVELVTLDRATRRKTFSLESDEPSNAPKPFPFALVGVGILTAGAIYGMKKMGQNREGK